MGTLPNIYTSEVLDAFKNAKIYNGWNTMSKTIIANEDSYLKMVACPEIIHQTNREYFESNYSSLQEGVADSVRIINEVDNNIIIDHKFKDNYYINI